MSKNELDSREHRSKLPATHRPHFVSVAKKTAIGYRKGMWYVRTFNGKSYKFRTVGQADDTLKADGVKVLKYEDVVRIAMAEPARAAEITKRYTVAQAFDDYFLHRRARSRSAESIGTDEGKVRAFVAKFGAIQVTELATSTLSAWRDRMVSPLPADDGSTEAQRRDALRASQASANRVWTICRAALNHAFNTGRVDSDLAWRRVKPFADVDEPRKRFLSVVEANKLLGAARGPFRDLVQAALLTGLRPGELIRLTVGQFTGKALEVSAGKSKSRFVPLTTQGVTHFAKLTKKRDAASLMLPSPNGAAWSRVQISRAMSEAVTAAGLETGAVFYDLRRSYGSLLANAGTGDAIIASALGHADTRMTRRHYAHLLDSVVAAELQSKLPTFKAIRSRTRASA